MCTNVVVFFNTMKRMPGFISLFFFSSFILKVPMTD